MNSKIKVLVTIMQYMKIRLSHYLTQKQLNSKTTHFMILTVVQPRAPIEYRELF